MYLDKPLDVGATSRATAYLPPRRKLIRRIESRLFDSVEKNWLGLDRDIPVSRTEFRSPLQSLYPASDYGHFKHYEAGSDRAVIVLPQRGGGYDGARMLSIYLAMGGIDVYALQPPARGERRPKDATWDDLDFANLRSMVYQAVSEVEGLARMLSQRAIGVLGMSFGAIYAGIAFGRNSRLQSAALIAGVGDLGRVIMSSRDKLAGVMRHVARRRCMSLEDCVRELAPIDPINFIDAKKSSRLLMVNATRDHSTPLACADALAKRWGAPSRMLLPVGHAGLFLYSRTICRAVRAHFDATLRIG